MSRWFRHYAGMVRDEKLVSAAVRSKQPVERVVWLWGAILESAAEINDNGKFSLDTAEAAYFLRADQADLDTIFSVLEELGRIYEQRVVKWGDRQFPSDRSVNRTRSYRDRKRSQDSYFNLEQGFDNVTPKGGDGHVTATKRHSDAPDTDTDTDTDTNTDTEKKERKRDGAIAPGPLIAEAVEIYNAVAEQAGWPRAQRLTPQRSAALRKRLAECGGIEGWRNAMAMARASPFLGGDNNRGWRANLDFFLQAKSFTKLMEGGYGRGNGQRQNPQSLADRALELAEQVRERELAAGAR